MFTVKGNRGARVTLQYITLKLVQVHPDEWVEELEREYRTVPV